MRAPLHSCLDPLPLAPMTRAWHSASPCSLGCSMFHGREVPDRVATQWGTHSLVAAVRVMLREALRDPANQRFLLLSGGWVWVRRQGNSPTHALF